MATDPSPISMTPVSVNQSPSPQRSRSVFIFALIFLVLALLIVGSAYFGKSYFTKQASSTPSPTPKPKTQSITGLEVAEKIALFLDKAAKPDGSFIELYNCTGTTCEPQVDQDPSKMVNGYTILFYRELYQKTNNPGYKEKYDRGASFWINKCEEGGIESPACKSNFGLFTTYYKDTKDQRYLDGLIKTGTNLLKEKSLKEALENNDGFKLASLYELTKNPAYLNQLEAIVKRLLDGEFDKDDVNPIVYQDGDFTVREFSFNIANFFYLPLYQITENKVYLIAAENLISKSKITSHLDAIINHFVTRHPIINMTLTTLLNLSELNTSNSTDYKNQAHIIGQELIYRFWDTPENKKFNGDYGFVGPFSHWSNIKRASFVTGWLAREYLRMSDEQFELVL